MKVETLKISCPYCLVGHADVPAVIHKDSTQVHDITTPRKCVMCDRYMVLVPKIDIRGITLEEAKEQGRHVA